jgi:hypothetical protein
LIAQSRATFEAQMTLFFRRLMMGLLALAVIAGASPVLAASFSGLGPAISNGDSLPLTPIQAALDEGGNSALPDESRRLGDLGGEDAAAIVASEPAVDFFGVQRNAHAGAQGWRAASVRSSLHQTGPPAA